jgi:DNA-binding SARP family transcriptional activator
MMAGVRYQVLGPLDAFTDAAPVSLGGPKQRLVLAVLLIEADRAVSDDRLVDELWADEPPDGARHAIQTYVSELRRVLTDEIVREGRGGVEPVMPDDPEQRSGGL